MIIAIVRASIYRLVLEFYMQTPQSMPWQALKIPNPRTCMYLCEMHCMATQVYTHIEYEATKFQLQLLKNFVDYPRRWKILS